MGDSSSPKLADFYLFMLEKDKIEKLISEKVILGYKRFLDDTIVFFRRGSFEKVNEVFQNLHESLKVTVERSSPEGIKFLDFVVYSSDTNILQIRNHRKQDRKSVV